MVPAVAAAYVVLHGLVTIGPTSPACESKPAVCSKPAVHALIEFTQAHALAMATTDTHGRYSLRIISGTWRVEITAGVRTTPNKIVVYRTASQTRNFKVDSGIR